MAFSMRISAYWGRLQRMPGADGPLVRWGILCTAGILLWSLLLDPWAEALRSERQLLYSRTMEAERLRVLQSQTEAWREADRQFREAMAKASQGLLHQSSATAAQSEIQRLVQGMARSHHMRVQSQHFMPSEGTPDLEDGVAIQLQLVGPAGDAYRFLHALARHDRLLVIERLKLSRRTKEEVNMFVRVAGFMAASEIQAEPPE